MIKLSSPRKSVLKLIFFLLLFVIAFWIASLATDNTFLQNIVSQYGYVAIFFVSLISGLNLIVPIPAAAFIPIFTESGFALTNILIVIIIGTTIADSAAYFLGKYSRDIMQSAAQSHFFKKIELWRAHYYWLPIIILFLFASFAPLPNELLIIPIAFFGYRFWQLFIPLLLGNAVFNALAAYGVLSIFKLF